MKILILFLLCIIPTVQCVSQMPNSGIYKRFQHPIEGCRANSEDIILYNDGSFQVNSCFANISARYSGGWWMTDSSLILHSSINCAGPRLLNKQETRNNNSELCIEIYNEKGLLKYCGYYDEQGSVRVLKSEGCFVENFKDNIASRRFDIVIKGKVIPNIRVRKRNNKIVCVVLEPISCVDVYLGRLAIPLCELEEVDVLR